MDKMKKVICLTGLSGSGKSTFLEYCQERGIPNFYTGDIIPKNASEEEKISFGIGLNERTSFIKRALTAAQRRYLDFETVIIDSIRSVEELAYIRSQSQENLLIGLTCCNRERIERIKRRDPTIQVEQIVDRDNKDRGYYDGYNFDVPKLLELADYVIDTSRSHEDTKQRYSEILEEVLNNGN